MGLSTHTHIHKSSRQPRSNTVRNDAYRSAQIAAWRAKPLPKRLFQVHASYIVATVGTKQRLC
jgi:hypothetical protein